MHIEYWLDGALLQHADSVITNPSNITTVQKTTQHDVDISSERQRPFYQPGDITRDVYMYYTVSGYTVFWHVFYCTKKQRCF